MYDISLYVYIYIYIHIFHPGSCRRRSASRACWRAAAPGVVVAIGTGAVRVSNDNNYRLTLGNDDNYRPR